MGSCGSGSVLGWPHHGQVFSDTLKDSDFPVARKQGGESSEVVDMVLEAVDPDRLGMDIHLLFWCIDSVVR